MRIPDYLKLSNEDNMELMGRYPDKYFDWAIVDPPYFDGPNKLGYYGARENSNGIKRPQYSKIGTWELPDAAYFMELDRVSVNQIVWGCNYYAQYLPVGRIVWDKVNGNNTFSDCELASVSTHTSVRMFSFMWNGMMQGKSIKEGKVQRGNKKLNQKRIHATEKPIELYTWTLQEYAKRGAKILDTHLGSGSHAIAVDKLNSYQDMDYNLVGCEIDVSLFDDSIKRLSKYIVPKTLF